MNEGDELSEELAEGRKAAAELAQHLRRMNAARMEIPVLIDDEQYIVTVEHVPVQN